MHRDVDVLQLSIVIALFALVAVIGFVAARWRRAASMDDLDEWGLGGRSFGPWVTWFLLGGDLYTAYTFVAVPALVFGMGAVGFFAVPYTIVMYPLVLIPAVRLWSVAHRHGFVTPADLVRGRHGSSALALAIAVTGIVATMPYIALQLVGIEAVLKTVGVTGNWPLIIAFAILAAYTYQSGLRAPALIAFVKDTLIYLVVLTAIIVIPIQLGGFDDIFGAARAKFAETPTPTDGVTLGSAAQLGYATLALGSAMALFLYPHSITGVLAARDRTTIKRNMATLPIYTIALGLLALLGYMAIAAGITPIGDDPNTIVPLLFDDQFPRWFAGVAFGAIAIGALVPAAIMSIAAANLFSRNIYKEYLNRDATPAQEARASKLASLVVKGGAVLVILALDPQFSIDLQLIGGVLILQTLPSIVLGLWKLAVHRWALLAGWAVGLASGLWMLYDTPNPTTGKAHFGGAQYALSKLGFGDTKVTIYTGIVATLANIVVVVLGTLVLRALKAPDGEDVTVASDFDADASDPRVEPLPAGAHPEIARA
ncbi:MAG: solute:Na+ symporter, family [Solirubrobacteraceae bacterium]|jgi:SSS family solute:Na+ symporter|nr:solute:Na+ symporter, family [Solirubrobacteraceae bacterium]